MTDQRGAYHTQQAASLSQRNKTKQISPRQRRMVTLRPAFQARLCLRAAVKRVKPPRTSGSTDRHIRARGLGDRPRIPLDKGTHVEPETRKRVRWRANDSPRPYPEVPAEKKQKQKRTVQYEDLTAEDKDWKLRRYMKSAFTLLTRISGTSSVARSAAWYFLLTPRAVPNIHP